MTSVTQDNHGSHDNRFTGLGLFKQSYVINTQ